MVHNVCLLFAIAYLPANIYSLSRDYQVILGVLPKLISYAQKISFVLLLYLLASPRKVKRAYR